MLRKSGPCTYCGAFSSRLDLHESRCEYRPRPANETVSYTASDQVIKSEAIDSDAFFEARSWWSTRRDRIQRWFKDKYEALTDWNTIHGDP